jgi:hypothetical protein
VIAREVAFAQRSAVSISARGHHQPSAGITPSVEWTSTALGRAPDTERGDASLAANGAVAGAICEFPVDRNAYDFYLTDPATGEMLTGCVRRSTVRIEILVVSPALWIAEALVLIEGEETKVQSSRFMRPEKAPRRFRNLELDRALAI